MGCGATPPRCGRLARFCVDPAAAAQDPAVADRALRELVDEAHAHGIYVILDIVLNHLGDISNY